MLLELNFFLAPKRSHLPATRTTIDNLPGPSTRLGRSCNWDLRGATGSCQGGRVDRSCKRWGKFWWQFMIDFDMIWGNFTLVFGEDFANLMSIESTWVSDHHGFMICYKFLCAMNLANCCARLFNFSLELTCTAESHMTQVTHMIIGWFNSMGEGLCQISKGSWAVMPLQTGLSFLKKVGISVKSGFSAWWNSIWHFLTRQQSGTTP